ncbi:metal transporter CNNM1-like [Diaphorina citri]|uniref:Metal transporter CNNM1-like n=1 Tax=Diaphorina citri TaxID=121845 RepID=A0A3Q0J922_DIACI|nr:metal transporter CNNM1-like [Diaphorina citri]
MLITFPLSYPMGKALDCLLGEEIGSIKTRENLKALVMATSNLVALKKDEVNIISGALEMTQKKVEEIMTKLDDCYMLDIETILNFTVISEIVYGNDRDLSHSKSLKKTYVVTPGSVQSDMVHAFIWLLATCNVLSSDAIDTIKLHNYLNSPFSLIKERGSAPPCQVKTDRQETPQGIKGHMAFVHKTDHDGIVATSNLVALKKDEVNIISGALEMTQKKVEEIMTKLDDCYMLDIETILNFTVISEIVRTGE